MKLKKNKNSLIKIEQYLRLLYYRCEIFLLMTKLY